MGKMGMQMNDSAPGKELMHQISSLQEMFNGCQFAGAQKAPAGNFNSVAISAVNSTCKHEIMVQKL